MINYTITVHFDSMQMPSVHPFLRRRLQQQQVVRDSLLVDTEELTQPSDEERLLRFELFCQTRSEADKSMLTLSTASLGFVITFLLSRDLPNWWVFSALVVSGLLFAFCCGSVLGIFQLNASYIQLAERDDRTLTKVKQVEKRLILMDKIARVSFIGGLLLTSAAALLTAIPEIKKNIESTPTQIESNVDIKEQSHDLKTTE